MTMPPPPPPPAPPRSRRRWKPTLSTWIVGPVVLLFVILGLVTSGIPGLLVMLALAGLVTAFYTIVTRRSSWAGLPRSRPIGLAVAGGALVLLVVGSSIGAAGASNLATSTSASHLAASTAPRAQVEATLTLADVSGEGSHTASDSLAAAGFRVVLHSADGAVVSDAAGMMVASQNPPAGTAIDKGAVVTLTMAPAVADTPSAAPTPTATAAPAPAPAPAPAKPAPAPPAPKPAPVAPVAPAPAPPPAATATIIPGAFCSPSDVGKPGVAANGRTYVCGGKGADASGHYHWNS